MEQDKTKMELPLDMVSISASICRTIILRAKKQFRDDDAICRFMLVNTRRSFTGGGWVTVQY